MLELTHRIIYIISIFTYIYIYIYIYIYVNTHTGAIEVLIFYFTFNEKKHHPWCLTPGYPRKHPWLASAATNSLRVPCSRHRAASMGFRSLAKSFTLWPRGRRRRCLTGCMTQHDLPGPVLYLYTARCRTISVLKLWIELDFRSWWFLFDAWNPMTPHCGNARKIATNMFSLQMLNESCLKTHAGQKVSIFGRPVKLGSAGWSNW